MAMPECDVENDNYYWLVTISEMERLLMVAKNDRKKFDDIISEKVDRELHHSLAGKSLGQVLDEYGVTGNEYIRQEKFILIPCCWMPAGQKEKTGSMKWNFRACQTNQK